MVISLKKKSINYIPKAEYYVKKTILFYVLIVWRFFTIEIVGDNSEDLFKNFMNDVPMTALRKTFEIDLRELIGERDMLIGIKPIDDLLW